MFSLHFLVGADLAIHQNTASSFGQFSASIKFLVMVLWGLVYQTSNPKLPGDNQ